MKSLIGNNEKKLIFFMPAVCARSYHLISFYPAERRQQKLINGPTEADLVRQIGIVTTLLPFAYSINTYIFTPSFIALALFGVCQIVYYIIRSNFL